ncbi:MAG: LarC family nickel insertion protein [Candidatus Omnitrophica bacterium]|nr:LarC family nickel insertion protein [Candidatus Omnitrophota bacterium]
MKSILFHLIGGASGDMLLSSLINLGCPLSYLKKEYKKLGLPCALELETVKGAHHKSKIIRFKEITSRRTDLRYQEIVKLIKNSRLAPAIKDKALSVYKLLFEVEQKIHKAKSNDFRFHHLGELDAILEICGFFIALDYFKVENVYISEFPLSVPAAATLALLKGKKVRVVNLDYETITPTAAALLQNAKQEDACFGYNKAGIGFGEAGEKDYLVAYLLDQRPKTEGRRLGIEHDEIIKVETNIDDMNPQIFESVLGALYKAGAKEVYLQQVVMKKSRPAFVLNALCAKADFAKIRDTLFSHTSTFGIRYQEFSRDKLPYTFIKKKTKFGPLTFRVSRGSVKKETPEYEGCLAIAQKRKMPLIEVYRGI